MDGDDDLLAALAKASSDAVRPAEPGDDVCGVPARCVVSPGSTDETAQVMRVAAEHDLSVVVRGHGTKLRWGTRPQRVDVVVETTRMSSVVEHVAGDLVVTTQAGTDLAALQDALAPAGQRLAIDPTQPADTSTAGTVGGLVATAASGPLRLTFGAVRDLLIGVTVVRADGVVAKAGGKVVKNVAGYDLSKLMCGSWGTLALVTQATFRLHPLPKAAVWVVAPVDSTAQVAALTQAVLRSQLAPAAIELDRPSGGRASIGVLAEGTTDGAPARAAAARELLGAGAQVSEEPPPWWGVAPWRPDGVAIRLTTEITGIATLLDALDSAAAGVGSRVDVRGSAGVGLLHAAMPPDTDPGAVAAVVVALRRSSARWGGEVVVLDAPDETRAGLDMWGPAGGVELMRRVKDQFDPEHRLAPGRFVGGI